MTSEQKALACGSCGHPAADHGPDRMVFGADVVYAHSACKIKGCYCTEWQRLEKCSTCGHVADVRHPRDHQPDRRLKER